MIHLTLNMHFFGTHTCLCRLHNCPSADFGVSQVRVSSNKKGLKTECEARAYYSYATLYRLLYWFWEKNRLFCSLTYWISMTLRDQIRSDPGRICSRVIAWDQALWWGTGEFWNKRSQKKGRVELLRRRPVGRSLEICFLCHRSTLNYTNLQMAFNEEWNGKRSSFCTGILAVIPDPIHTRISTTILPTFCIFIFGKMELEAPYFWSLPQTPTAVHNFPFLTL